MQPTSLAPHDLERSVKESLAKLRLDVIDLLLLHWPNPQSAARRNIGRLAKMKRMGYTRHWRSNFTVALLEEANRGSSEPLVCNQIEMPSLPRPGRDCRGMSAKGMAVVAYSLIARGKAKETTLIASAKRTARRRRRRACVISCSRAVW